MAPFGSPRRGDASLARRHLLLAGGAAALAGCGRGAPLTAASTPPLDMKRLNQEVGAIGRRVAPGVLGVGLMNLDTVESWTLNGDRRFPMQSVFKAPLGAAVLAEVDAGRLSLDEVFRLEEMDLSPPYSPVADAWPGRSDWTARELLVAAVGGSDNTAADVLMRRIGGPGAVTAWLVGKRIDEVRVDRYERELQTESVGLTPFRPAWRGEANFLRALAAVPPDAERAALQAYLTDPRDTATPRGMLNFLQRLDSGQLISPASNRLLLQIMTATGTGAARLKAGLPAGAVLAHKTGAARTLLGVNPAVNDVGLLTLPNRRSYAVAVFLSGSTLADAERDAAIADVARAIVRSLG